MKTTGAIRARNGHQDKYSLLSRTETAANFIITRLSIGYTNNHIFHSETTFTFD